MQSVANLEQSILENLRQLPLEKQQEVLDFAEFLRQKLASVSTAQKQTLQAIAAMTIAERHKILAPSIAATAQDFLTDPELAEFSVLDTKDWEPA
jgi:flagellar hook-basal body complex protein FliE